MFWRNLSTPGHDACWVEKYKSGWRLSGAAIFLHGKRPVILHYQVVCDSKWRTLSGRVQGTWDGNRILFDIIKTRGVWTLNGRKVPGLEGCVDLDFGFTPATNFIPIKRAALKVGQGADLPAAWLDVERGKLSLLKQRYERRGKRKYWYRAPRFKYKNFMELNNKGFVKEYLGLFSAL